MYSTMPFLFGFFGLGTQEIMLLLVLGVYPSPAVRWAKASSFPIAPARPSAGPASVQAVAPSASQTVLQ